MSDCGCKNGKKDVPRNIGPIRIIKTTAPLLTSDESKESEEVKEQEVQKKLTIKFM